MLASVQTNDLAQPAATLLAQVTPFLAALLGATVGGATAYILQRRQFRHQQAILDRDREDEEEAIGLSVLLKINRVLTTVTRVREQIDEGVAGVTRPDRLDLWAKTREFSSELPSVEVSIDELVFVKRLKDLNALNEMMDLQEANRVYVESLKLYGDLRRKLSERMVEMASPETMGDTVSADFTDAQIAKVAPEMARLNKLLIDLHGIAVRDVPSLLDLFRRVQRLAKERLAHRAAEFAIPEPDGPLPSPEQ